jgi:hypothetical protein
MSTDPPLPDRFCEICGIIHKPPIHDLATCHPCRADRISFSPVDPDHWPTKEEMAAAVAYWDAVLSDKGIKPLS